MPLCILLFTVLGLFLSTYVLLVNALQTRNAKLLQTERAEMVRDVGIFTVFMQIINYVVVLATRAIERRVGILLNFGAYKTLRKTSPSLSLYEGRKGPEVSRELLFTFLNEAVKGGRRHSCETNIVLGTPRVGENEQILYI